jgi:hypothetical protein
VDAAALRVQRYAETLLSELTVLARSCGHEDPSQLGPGDALVMTEVGHWVPARQAVRIDVEA